MERPRPPHAGLAARRSGAPPHPQLHAAHPRAPVWACAAAPIVSSPGTAARTPSSSGVAPSLTSSVSGGATHPAPKEGMARAISTGDASLHDERVSFLLTLARRPPRGIPEREPSHRQVWTLANWSSLQTGVRPAEPRSGHGPIGHGHGHGSHPQAPSCTGPDENRRSGSGCDVEPQTGNSLQRLRRSLSPWPWPWPWPAVPCPDLSDRLYPTRVKSAQRRSDRFGHYCCLAAWTARGVAGAGHLAATVVVHAPRARGTHDLRRRRREPRATPAPADERSLIGMRTFTDFGGWHARGFCGNVDRRRHETHQ